MLLPLYNWKFKYWILLPFFKCKFKYRIMLPFYKCKFKYWIVSQHQSVLVHPGKQTHIVVNPSLIVTSDDAIKSLTTTERQCYADHEVRGLLLMTSPQLGDFADPLIVYILSPILWCIFFMDLLFFYFF